MLDTSIHTYRSSRIALSRQKGGLYAVWRGIVPHHAGDEEGKDRLMTSMPVRNRGTVSRERFVIDSENASTIARILQLYLLRAKVSIFWRH